MMTSSLLASDVTKYLLRVFNDVFSVGPTEKPLLYLCYHIHMVTVNKGKWGKNCDIVAGVND